MLESVLRLGTISRASCRRDAEDRFSRRALVDGYESLYYDAVGMRLRGVERVDELVRPATTGTRH
jgi:hypothetical protein